MNAKAEHQDLGVAATGLRGVMRHNEPMSRHTSWRVGGPADRFYQPADVEDLARFLGSLPAEEPLVWVGLGSNLLVRDGGIRGTVVATAGVLNVLEFIAPDGVRVEVGVASAKLARFSTHNGLAGAEFLAGIPGTVGGALAMNAGAFGGETWDIVQSVRTVDRGGRLRRRTRSDYEIRYRTVTGPAHEWFVAADFKLKPGDPGAGKARIKSLLARRGGTQPIQVSSAGSVFRNPPGDFAARLTESAGLKGVCEGRACVSVQHANFIVNQGGATAAQIEALVHRMQAEVERVHGVRLEPEVQLVGEPSDQPFGRSAG